MDEFLNCLKTRLDHDFRRELMKIQPTHEKRYRMKKRIAFLAKIVNRVAKISYFCCNPRGSHNFRKVRAS